jgi:20S proteasome alpha/beta subunit
LEKNFQENMSEEDSVRLAIKSLLEVFDVPDHSIESPK